MNQKRFVRWKRQKMLVPPPHFLQLFIPLICSQATSNPFIPPATSQIMTFLVRDGKHWGENHVWLRSTLLGCHRSRKVQMGSALRNCIELQDNTGAKLWCFPDLSTWQTSCGSVEGNPADATTPCVYKHLAQITYPNTVSLILWFFINVYNAHKGGALLYSASASGRGITICSLLIMAEAEW